MPKRQFKSQQLSMCMVSLQQNSKNWYELEIATQIFSVLLVREHRWKNAGQLQKFLLIVHWFPEHMILHMVIPAMHWTAFDKLLSQLPNWLTRVQKKSLSIAIKPVQQLNFMTNLKSFLDLLQVSWYVGLSDCDWPAKEIHVN